MLIKTLTYGSFSEFFLDRCSKHLLFVLGLVIVGIIGYVVHSFVRERKFTRHISSAKRVYA